MKILYCPACGSEVNIITCKCNRCETDIKPFESEFDLKYYMEESNKKYGHSGNFYNILEEREIFSNPHYNAGKYNKAKEIESENSIKTFNKINNMNNNNIPKCPTCQSTNIKKISSTRKVAHGLTFGIFSKTAFSQYECNNCGYKW